MSIFGVFVVRIFSYLGWIRRDTEHLSVLTVTVTVLSVNVTDSEKFSGRFSTAIMNVAFARFLCNLGSQ